jgi:hypothetical protein
MVMTTGAESRRDSLYDYTLGMLVRLCLASVMFVSRFPHESAMTRTW